MSIRTKILLTAVIVLILLATVGSYIVWRTSSISHNLKQDMPRAIQGITDAAYLDSLAQIIHYYDEVLTQSARNYAFTGAADWKTRYETSAPKLDQAIKEAITKGSIEDKKIFSSIDEANIALVNLEQQSITLVDAGDTAGAQALLDGAAYWQQKKIYQDGLNQYLVQRNAKSDEAITISTASIQKIESEVETTVYITQWSSILLIALIILLFLLQYLILQRSVLKPLQTFENAAKEIAAGNLKQEVVVNTHDEIGQLSQSFNVMARELQESRSNIEKKVASRTKSLEQLNANMVGRELKMIELKKEISQMKNKISGKQ